VTDLELILTMLGEASTTHITQGRNSEEFEELREDAKSGGKIAGNTRKQIEIKSGKKVISDDNYLDVPESQKRLILLK